MPSTPSLEHQRMVHELGIALDAVVVRPHKGNVYPGMNISDRRDWKENYRVPDLVVLLKNSKAIPCDTFILGGPDFIVEIQSPADDTEKKIPFYEKVEVGELLIIHRDTRQLRLLRHNGRQLVPVALAAAQGRKSLASAVVALAFRRIMQKGKPRIEARRTDGKEGLWII